MSELISNNQYPNLLSRIQNEVQKGQEKAYRSINHVLVETYWKIGMHIVEFEQEGQKKAMYGSELLNRLSKDLSLSYGKGFSRSNLFQIRAFYLKFQKIQTLSGFLSLSHYVEILKADTDLEIEFYLKQCENENWSVRELKRQMNSMLFHRIALSQDKESVMNLAKNGIEIRRPESIIKDPYVLEFLKIPQDDIYSENDLEEKLIHNMKLFLMELGKGFTFVGKQYKITLGSRHFYVDLVFYHRILKCFILIDLKKGEITHNDIGQMNLYLNYFKKEENTEGDAEPIGIVLGAYKDEILIEYACENISNQLFVSKYQLYLPDKEKLKKELQILLEN
jgi:predicted nuclease of restriction endonuclease-like (RecB) superfamily